MTEDLSESFEKQKQKELEEMAEYLDKPLLLRKIGPVYDEQWHVGGCF